MLKKYAFMFLLCGAVVVVRTHAHARTELCSADSNGEVSGCYSCGEAGYACGIYCDSFGGGGAICVEDDQCEDLLEGGTSPDPVTCVCNCYYPD